MPRLKVITRARHVGLPDVAARGQHVANYRQKHKENSEIREKSPLR